MDCFMPAIRRTWREVESSPLTGKLSARPAGKPGDFLIAKESLQRSLPRHFLFATPDHTERSVCVFKAGRNLSVRCWSNHNQTPGRGRATSRWSAPGPGKRTRREDHVPLIVRDEFRTGYSLIGLLASIARLRFPGRRRLACAPHRTLLKGTFLLCQEGDISTLP